MSDTLEGGEGVLEWVDEWMVMESGSIIGGEVVCNEIHVAKLGEYSCNIVSIRIFACERSFRFFTIR